MPIKKDPYRKNRITDAIARDRAEVEIPRYIHLSYYFDESGTRRTKQETDKDSDYVDVVRCRNCRYPTKEDHTHWFCPMWDDQPVDKDWFCAKGKKRNIYMERFLARKKEREEQERKENESRID